MNRKKFLVQLIENKHLNVALTQLECAYGNTKPISYKPLSHPLFGMCFFSF